MSKAQPTPLNRRLAQAGGFDTGNAGISVWAYVNHRGSSSQVSIDMHHSAGCTSLEIPTGLVQQLVNLLNSAAHMAQTASEMSAKEWAEYKQAENEAAVRAAVGKAVKGGAV